VSPEHPELDGWLTDYTVKGNKVELEGTEIVEGQGTYRLKVSSAPVTYPRQAIRI
jgi:hypothetical protein